jgi:hypothetical protein
MKTTVELDDALLDRCRKLARREGITLRALIEEGLRLALAGRRRAPPLRPFKFPVYGGSGMTEEFKDADWNRVRDEIYRGHGG